MADFLNSVGRTAGGWETTTSYANGAGLLRQARQDVRRILDGRHLPGDTIDDAVLLVDELVANAASTSTSEVVVSLRHLHGLLRIDVRDSSVHPHVPGPSSFTDLGLDVIDCIATRWGWQPVAGGRYTWATIEYE